MQLNPSATISKSVEPFHGNEGMNFFSSSATRSSLSRWDATIARGYYVKSLF